MIVCFNGPPGSGKDESSLFLKTNFGFEHLQFKDILFQETCDYFNIPVKIFMEGYDNREIKETKREPFLGYKTRREALIHVSENVIKPKHGPDYFGIKTAEKLNLVSDYTISDFGFYHELLPIINIRNDVIIVQLFRSGCNYSNDSRSYVDGNLQETFFCGDIPQTPDNQTFSNDRFKEIPMYRIYNNGSISDLHNKLRTIIRS